MLAKRAGFDQSYNPVIASALGLDEWDVGKWNTAVEGVCEAGYNTWASNATIAKLNPPSWANFKKNPTVRYPAAQEGPFALWVNNNTNPFALTASGKIEAYSNFFANPTTVAATQFSYNNLGGATGTTTSASSSSYASICLGLPGRGATALPQWANAIEHTFYDPNTANYPLTVISPNSYYRSHSSNFLNPALHGDCYMHRAWISVADANARGINDNDLVRVFSDVGEMYIPAYVTARITPGVVAIYHGGFYVPGGVTTTLMPDGIDVGGNMNFLTKDDQPGNMYIGPVVESGPVQVEKVGTPALTATTTS
jgi:anaerobic dimethyl sulfoxide reductase subunit A